MITFLDDDSSDYWFYKEGFDSFGETLSKIKSNDFSEVVLSHAHHNFLAIEAIIIDTEKNLEALVDEITKAMDVPVIVLTKKHSLTRTKALFEKGADDIVLKPVHPAELLLRIAAVKRRTIRHAKRKNSNLLTVHFDGREPEFNGRPIELRRRERRILEYLILINGRRATKSQLFDAVYGTNEGDYEDTLIESHICRLRKKLKQVIGHDPINSIRHFGYQLDNECIGIRAAQDLTIAA